MSFAWATIALLVLLLPGFLFFVTLYIPERFTRDTVPRGPLGHLAAAVLISFAIHGLGYATLAPRVDTEALLAILQLQGAESMALGQLAEVLERSRWWLFFYLTVTCGVGAFGGFVVGKVQAGGGLPGLVQHSWIYDLRPTTESQYVIAYAMTNVKEGPRVLMYKGFLEQFGLRADGRFSYLVLSKPIRYYMHLEPDGAVTADKTNWREIGARTLAEATDEHLLTYLVIEGEDLANVVFERYSWPATRALVEAMHGSDSEFAEYLEKRYGEIFSQSLDWPPFQPYDPSPSVEQESELTWQEKKAGRKRPRRRRR